MRSKIFLGIIIFVYCILPQLILAKENWILDKELSIINFELPVFLAKNVQGKFTQIEGLVEIDLETKKKLNEKNDFSWRKSLS